jgi:hypothetical protein
MENPRRLRSTFPRSVQKRRQRFSLAPLDWRYIFTAATVLRQHTRLLAFQLWLSAATIWNMVAARHGSRRSKLVVMLAPSRQWCPGRTGGKQAPPSEMASPAAAAPEAKSTANAAIYRRRKRSGRACFSGSQSASTPRCRALQFNSRTVAGNMKRTVVPSSWASDPLHRDGEAQGVAGDA